MKKKLLLMLAAVLTGCQSNAMSRDALRRTYGVAQQYARNAYNRGTTALSNIGASTKGYMPKIAPYQATRPLSNYTYGQPRNAWGQYRKPAIAAGLAGAGLGAGYIMQQPALAEEINSSRTGRGNIITQTNSHGGSTVIVQGNNCSVTTKSGPTGSYTEISSRNALGDHYKIVIDSNKISITNPAAAFNIPKEEIHTIKFKFDESGTNILIMYGNDGSKRSNTVLNLSYPVAANLRSQELEYTIINNTIVLNVPKGSILGTLYNWLTS